MDLEATAEVAEVDEEEEDGKGKGKGKAEERGPGLPSGPQNQGKDVGKGKDKGWDMSLAYGPVKGKDTDTGKGGQLPPWWWLCEPRSEGADEESESMTSSQQRNPWGVDSQDLPTMFELYEVDTEDLPSRREMGFHTDSDSPHHDDEDPVPQVHRYHNRHRAWH